MRGESNFIAVSTNSAKHSFILCYQNFYARHSKRDDAAAKSFDVQAIGLNVQVNFFNGTTRFTSRSVFQQDRSLRVWSNSPSDWVRKLIDVSPSKNWVYRFRGETRCNIVFRSCTRHKIIYIQLTGV